MQKKASFPSLPLFYTSEINDTAGTLMLDEDTSKHVVAVLRMTNGDQLNLTDGRGNIFTVEIINDNKKKCTVSILTSVQVPGPATKVSLAVSLVKNASRFEWLLEKATEIGINEIIPLLCDRTEKQHFRQERMKGILISAMLQSQQAWLPELHEPTAFRDIIESSAHQQKFIAHCEQDEKQPMNELINRSANRIILIGPEGDFSPEEIKLAINNNFIPVALGDTRLRTETAAIVAATLLCIG